MNRAGLVAAAIGLVLALLAIARNDSRIAWAAMVVLAGTLIARLIARRRRDRVD